MARPRFRITLLRAVLAVITKDAGGLHLVAPPVFGLGMNWSVIVNCLPGAKPHPLQSVLGLRAKAGLFFVTGGC